MDIHILAAFVLSPHYTSFHTHVRMEGNGLSTLACEDAYIAVALHWGCSRASDALLLE